MRRFEQPVLTAGLALLVSMTAECRSSTIGYHCEGRATCSDRGDCDGSSGASICQCDEGYAGHHCEVCDTGYTDFGDGDCLPDDPCSETTVCGNRHRECINDLGTAFCGPCSEGYTDYGDGHCLPADPCVETTECGDRHRDCFNEQGTAVCGPCTEGYADYGDGECRDADPCTATPVCFVQHRQCSNNQGTAVCGDCVPGYAEDGGICRLGCTSASFLGEIAPLDLLLLVDRSSSMSEEDRFTTMVAAVSNFVASADASGVGVGVQYFPVLPTATIPTICTTDAQCGLYGPCIPMMNVCGGSMAEDTSCDPQDYTPVDTPIATLPGVAGAVQSSLVGHAPEGSATAIQPALEGVLTYARLWAQTHTDSLTYLVLITNAQPTGCRYNSIAGAEAALLAAANGSPSVGTFVIGFGTAQTDLDDLAAAGGTQQAYLVDMGANPALDIADAFADIRAHGRCRYRIPQPVVSSGEYALVALNFVDASNPTMAAGVPLVANAASCDPNLGGWHYDDLVEPKVIRLCPASCRAWETGGVEVEVVVGCSP